MNVLVVGGSGLIGGEIALHLKSQGHDITIMARKVRRLG
ncbi:NAD-dependent epimerase/dehydratase family protein [Zhongshania sp.]|nr:NAD-dependent epimerase/dehydratase family protein [Zhongshania sp.]MBQ0796936.1 NAD-dependent epimerase/dehydratase family protein [Zhongshania sp.]